MQTYNKDAYGYKLYCNFEEDISANTALTMTIRPQFGDDIDVTPTLETSDATVDDQTFNANEFVSYMVPSGKFDSYVGRYRVMATALVGSEMKVTKWQEFRITAGAD